jgi:hypothetical protein
MFHSMAKGAIMTDQTDREDLSRQILARFHLETDGDMNRTFDMWELGERVGLDRSQTENLIMELVSEGWLEIRSLSGAIALTETGCSRAAADASSTGAGSSGLIEFIEQLETALPDLSLDDRTRLDMEIDLKTLRLQQERSEPAPSVVQDVLRAMEGPLAASSQSQARHFLDILTGLLDEA